MKKTVLLLVLALALACSAALAEKTVITPQKGYWKDGALYGVPFGIAEREGFSYPVFSLDLNSLQPAEETETRCYYSQRVSRSFQLTYTAQFFNDWPEFHEDDQNAEYACYKGTNWGIDPDDDFYKILKDELIRIDGHLARLTTARFVHARTGFDGMVSTIVYFRNEKSICISFYAEGDENTTWAQLPKITMDDLKAIAEYIHYDPSSAEFTAEDGAISVSSGSGQYVLSAGKTLQMTADYVKPEARTRVRQGWMASYWQGSEATNWYVLDAETGEAPAGVTIDKKGKISADRQIEKTMQIKVCAESRPFHTKADCVVTVIPQASGITLEPEEIIFFAGTEDTEILKAVIEPEIPPVGLVWTASGKGIVEIVPGEDGTAEVIPSGAGSATVTVKEPGGKSAKANVRVLIPAEDLELSYTGKPVPGGTVTLKGTVSPAKAGDRNVEWAIDVGEDIATIDKGRIRIEKTAPSGSVITVTGTATGAPEPIVRTIRITVE